MVAVAEGVHVDSRCRVRRSARLAMPPRLGLGEILVGGEFDVAAVSRERRDLDAGPFGQRRVVGEILAAFARRRADAPRAARELERLRRLHAREAARGRPCPSTWPPASTRLIVSVTWQRRDGGAGVAAGGDGARHQFRSSRTAAPRHGPARCRARGAQRLQARSHRSLPRRAARHRRQQPQALGRRLVGAAVVGMDDRLHGADLAVPGEQRQACPDDRLAGQLTVLLGQTAPGARARARLRQSPRRPTGPYSEFRLQIDDAGLAL